MDTIRIILTPSVAFRPSDSAKTPLVLTSDEPLFTGQKGTAPFSKALTVPQAAAFVEATSEATIATTLRRGYVDLPTGKRGRRTLARTSLADIASAAAEAAKAAKAEAKAAKATDSK